MKAMYRGIHYEQQPAAAPLGHTFGGTYRGHLYAWHSYSLPAHPFTVLPVRYRGILVGDQRPAYRIATAATKQEQLRQAADVHRQHVLQRLQARLQSAQAKGDAELIRALEEERRQYA